jgi:hypothetical protein
MLSATVKKWSLWIIGMVVGLGLLAALFACYKAMDKYSEMSDALHKEQSTSRDLLVSNSALKAENDRIAQDAIDKTATSSGISFSQAVLSNNMQTLQDKLSSAIAARDAEAAKVQVIQKANVGCTSEARQTGSSPVGKADPVELDIAWEAYCAVSPDVAACQEKNK